MSHFGYRMPLADGVVVVAVDVLHKNYTRARWFNHHEITRGNTPHSAPDLWRIQGYHREDYNPREIARMASGGDGATPAWLFCLASEVDALHPKLANAGEYAL